MYIYFTEQWNPRRTPFSAFSAPEEIHFKYFFRWDNNNKSHKQIYSTPYVYADVPPLPLPCPAHSPSSGWQGRRATPPALICPICRVRNNKSAAKNKRCENCCQFAVAPTRSDNSGKILFQQIKSTWYTGRECCKLWGNMMALLGIFYHLNARHTGVNSEYPGRRPSHSRSCHPGSASESESVPSAYRTLWCRASSNDWVHAWTGQG